MSDEQTTPEVASIPEAIELVEFDIEDVLEALAEANRAIHGDEEEGPRHLHFTFRVASPEKENEVEELEDDPTKVRYSCNLTGMSAIVPNGAPVPALLVVDMQNNLVEEVWRMHPDLVDNREHFFKVLISKLTDDVQEGLHSAFQAAILLLNLDHKEEINGLAAATGASYPAGRGYEVEGQRPIQEE